MNLTRMTREFLKRYFSEFDFSSQIFENGWRQSLAKNYTNGWRLRLVSC